VVSDLPVSARFFAGGSTTVRGFPLDRLGVFDADCVSCSVINPTTGLSVGGNAVVVVNAEVRRALTNINRNLAVVTFLDGGNVFPNVADVDLTRIRGSAGFGVRYDSPFGPLRLDFGFKLNRLVIGERRESAWEYHLSIGEAF
jgi:outer membrane translocation and assembly module TamA